jgi:hypothetical protein
MVTQLALRPYATAGIALVGASIIAVTPVAAPPPSPQVQTRPVQLVDAWTDLFTNTAANLANITDNADTTAIAGVFSALLSNPLGVIEAFTNVDPTVTTTTGIPLGITVELPPADEIGIAGLGADIATFQAINEVVGQLASDPSNALSTLIEAPAVIGNAFLNGADNVNILDGIINIPVVNGILSPLQPMDIDLNLTNLIDALGLGDLSLSNLDLSSLLGQLGLGDITLNSLFDDLGIGDTGLGTLLADATSPITTLGGLLNLLGLNDLGLNDSITVNLTQVLSGLGLDSKVNLNDLTVADVLNDFGINSPLSDLSNLSLSSILTSFGVDVPTSATLGDTTLTSLLTDLGLNNLGLGTLLADAAPVLGGTLQTTIDTLLDIPTVEGLLNDVNLGDLVTGLTLGNGGSLSLDTLLSDLGVNLPSSTDLANTDIADVLSSLGVKLPGDLTIAGLLGDLGFSGNTSDLTLGGLLSDLGNPFGSLDITSLLNGLTLDQLFTDLGLGDTPLDLDLSGVSDLTLGGLLGDLGLSDIANISVDNFGGLVTELADVIPQQILASI